MKLGTSQRGTLVPALAAFMVLAGVSVSLAARPDPTPTPEPSASVTVAQPGRSGHHDDEGPGGSDEPSSSEGPSADSLAACASALDVGDVALEEQRGLERAIEVVLANCEKNPAAVGLVNALEQLRANQERQSANEHGGQPNENASEQASGNAETPPGQKAGADTSDGNGQSAERANEHSNDSTHP